jgi:DNA-binding response OmpR family regulator
MSARDSRGGRRVLVVEDEADLLATCERLLGRHGYEVIIGSSRWGRRSW